MFEALTSRYIIWNLSFKNESPLAAPIATLILVVQGSGSGPRKSKHENAVST